MIFYLVRLEDHAVLQGVGAHAGDAGDREDYPDHQGHRELFGTLVVC